MLVGQLAEAGRKLMMVGMPVGIRGLVGIQVLARTGWLIRVKILAGIGGLRVIGVLVETKTSLLAAGAPLYLGVGRRRALSALGLGMGMLMRLRISVGIGVLRDIGVLVEAEKKKAGAAGIGLGSWPPLYLHSGSLICDKH